MKYGLVPPIVHRNPRFSPPAWESEAEIEDLAEIARAADRLGYDFICFPNHVAIPESAADVRGSVYWDPVATMGYVAAHTQTIKLAAYIVVLGYYHPLQIAKSFGTIDRISRGRLILGVGVGSLQPEFELLGRPFDDRGKRADDSLRALRASLSSRIPEYHGEFFDYDGFVVDPHAVQSRVPIWVGGRTARSLHRALDLADGWAPFRLDPHEVRALIDLRRDGLTSRAEFELVFPPDPPLDPIGAADAIQETIEVWRNVGATALNLRFVHRSKSHYLEQLDAFRGIANN